VYFQKDKQPKIMTICWSVLEQNCFRTDVRRMYEHARNWGLSSTVPFAIL